MLITLFTIKSKLMKVLFIVSILVLLFAACEQKSKNDTFSMTATLTDVESGVALLYLLNKEKNQFDTVAFTEIENNSFVFDSARIAIDGPTKLTLLLKPKTTGTERSTYSKKLVILENKPLVAQFGMLDGVSEIPESKYHDLVINLDSKDPELKFLMDSIILMTGKYMEIISDKEKKEEIIATNRVLGRLSKEYKLEKVEVVSQIFNKTDDVVYKGLLLDAYGQLLDPTDYITYANSVMPDLDKSSLTYKNIEELKNEYGQEKELTVGKSFIDFSANNLEGNQVGLAKVISENEYTLLDFWASWCGPCRNEIPKMKKAYDQYNSKGFEIYMVSIDSKKEAWEKASNEEGFVWVNTYDKTTAKNLYIVNSIPQNFLISKSGEIIAINLKGEALKSKLAELLN